MKELVYRKKIIIPYCGYISLLKLRGPIDKPYMETIDNINKLIISCSKEFYSIIAYKFKSNIRS